MHSFASIQNDTEYGTLKQIRTITMVNDNNGNTRQNGM